VKTPLILSLVYKGGTILASKRSPYADLLVRTFDEKVLESRLNRQHKLICAAIRAGRIEDLKKMTLKESSPKGKTDAPAKEVAKTTVPKVETPRVAIPKPEIVLPSINKVLKAPLSPVLEEKPVEPILPLKEKGDGIPKPNDEPVWDIPIIEDVKIVEEEYFDIAQIIEEEIVLPPEAVEIIGDLEQFGGLLENELRVKILGENKFASGERKNINILVCRGDEDLAVEKAEVTVKIIGSDFRPTIYHSQADGNGIATVQLALPTFRSGRAAILIRASIDGEETELRRAITPE